MFIEEALHYAVLQHTAESNSESSRCPGELADNAKLAASSIDAPVAMAPAAGSRLEKAREPVRGNNGMARNQMAIRTASVALCVAAANATIESSPIRS